MTERKKIGGGPEEGSSRETTDAWREEISQQVALFTQRGLRVVLANTNFVPSRCTYQRAIAVLGTSV